MTQSDQLPIAKPRNALSLRAFLLGTFSAIAINAITPFNDFVVGNTFLTSGYFPPALVLVIFLFAVVLNAPLRRFCPDRALTTPELATIVGMAMFACIIPGSGLMRLFLPMHVAPLYHAQSSPALHKALVNLDLPSWVFPVPDLATGPRDPVVTLFYTRLQQGDSLPWAAWVPTLLGWGLFVASMYAALIALGSLVRDQWMTNERLQFPLLQVQVALLEPAEPGRMLNGLLRSRAFWIAAAIVFVLHSTTALAAYFPRTVPAIPLSYDLNPLFSEPPFSYVMRPLKANRFIFTFIALAFFMPSRVSFSIFFIYLVINVIYVQQMWIFGVDIADGAWFDQHLSASVVYLLLLIWVGRHHWSTVLRHLFRGPGDDRARSLRAPAIVAVLGVAGMVSWLLVVGVTWWVALTIVALLLIGHLMVARVLAETGLPLYRTVITPQQVTFDLPASALTGRDVFFAGAMTSTAFLSSQGSALPMSLHAAGLHHAAGQSPSRWRWGVVIAWTLLISYLVASASSLRVYYDHASTLQGQGLENGFGMDTAHKRVISEALETHADGRVIAKRYSSVPHYVIGAVVMGVLQLGAWRFASWPLAPVAYLVATSNFIAWVWFSTMLGWLCKTLIVRFGGVTLLRAAKPFFIGLLMGECLAVGFWLVFNFAMALAGFEYHPVSFILG